MILLQKAVCSFLYFREKSTSAPLQLVVVVVQNLSKRISRLEAQQQYRSCCSVWWCVCLVVHFLPIAWWCTFSVDQRIGVFSWQLEDEAFWQTGSGVVRLYPLLPTVYFCPPPPSPLPPLTHSAHTITSASTFFFIQHKLQQSEFFFKVLLCRCLLDCCVPCAIKRTKHGRFGLTLPSE